MGDQYGLPDLRQLMAGRTLFPTLPQVSEPLSSGSNLTATLPQPNEATPWDSNIGRFAEVARSSSIILTPAAAGPCPSVPVCDFETDGGCCNIGSDGGQSRWPRQETLTLLEIRSRLDYKFKETNNQKGPLWDEVSRRMKEEYGYQRSGKKCREKFENLYKYYKKTREGKHGKHDGKHYRFFRQLEALCGGPINPASKSKAPLVTSNLICDQTTSNYISSHANQEALQGMKLHKSFSLSNSSEFDTSSFENNKCSLSLEKKSKIEEQNSFGKTKKCWKVEMKDFVSSYMMRLTETQEAWMEKMLKIIEHKEKERMIREDEWRKQETARCHQEYEFWANERAWIEARDTALMEAFQRFTSRELKIPLPQEAIGKGIHEQGDQLEDNATKPPNSTNEAQGELNPEISNLIQLRTNIAPKFQEIGYSRESLWEDIAAKMCLVGYDQSAARCKETWESKSMSLHMDTKMESQKKAEKNSRSRSTCVEELNSHNGQEFVKKEPKTFALHLNESGIPNG